MNKHKKKIEIWGLLILIITALAALYFYIKSKSYFNFMTSAEAMKDYIRSYGDKAFIIFFIIQFLSVIVAPIPSNITSAVGGTIFGMWNSFYISTASIILASIILFVIAKKLGRPIVNKFVNPKTSSKYEKYISSKNGEILVVLMLLLPLFPDDAIVFLAGLSKIKVKKFFFILLLTRPWGIFAASAVGSSSIIIPWWLWILIVIITIFIVKNSYRLEKKLILFANE